MCLGDLDILSVHVKNIGMDSGQRVKIGQQTKQMLMIKQNIHTSTTAFYKKWTPGCPFFSPHR